MATTSKKDPSETADQPKKKTSAKKASSAKAAAAKKAEEMTEQTADQEVSAPKASAKKASAKKDAAKKTTKKASAKVEAEEVAPEGAPADVQVAEEAPADAAAPAKKAPAKKATKKAAPAKDEAPAKEAAKPASAKKAPSKRVKAKIYVEDENGKRIIIDNEVPREDYAAYALADSEILDAFMESLRGNGRRIRQFAATVVAIIAQDNPEAVAPYASDLIVAMQKPESQTRWEALEALSHIVPSLKPEDYQETIVGAELSLDDEESGIARYKAFKFLCALGAYTPELSRMVWTSIDEAIQCYHGDPEFQDMLNELVLFARGDIDAGVREKLVARMSFDAVNGKGALKRKAEVIVNTCK